MCEPSRRLNVDSFNTRAIKRHNERSPPPISIKARLRITEHLLLLASVVSAYLDLLNLELLNFEDSQHLTTFSELTSLKHTHLVFDFFKEVQEGVSELILTSYDISVYVNIDDVSTYASRSI
jgi:hypothetical protein